MTKAATGRVLFLVNPEAGGGRTEARLRRLLSQAPALAGRSNTAWVRSTAEACAALRGLEPGDIPVATGGDGTVTLVATALREAGRQDTPLALLPLGTGNLVARELGLDDPRLALRALERGTVRRIDVMRTSHPAAPLALASISCGFEGVFIARYAGLRRGGRLLAALGALPAAWDRGATPALECDGEILLAPTDAAYSVGLYNTGCYVAGLVMSPGADVADGWGEGVVYRTARAYWTAMAGALRGGAPGAEAGVVRRRWRVARLESRGPLQFDGEPASGGTVSVWMEPGALPVVVPAAG